MVDKLRASRGSKGLRQGSAGLQAKAKRVTATVACALLATGLTGCSLNEVMNPPVTAAPPRSSSPAVDSAKPAQEAAPMQVTPASASPAEGPTDKATKEATQAPSATTVRTPLDDGFTAENMRRAVTQNMPEAAIYLRATGVVTSGQTITVPPLEPGMKMVFTWACTAADDFVESAMFFDYEQPGSHSSDFAGSTGCSRNPSFSISPSNASLQGVRDVRLYGFSEKLTFAYAIYVSPMTEQDKANEAKAAENTASNVGVSGSEAALSNAQQSFTEDALRAYVLSLPGMSPESIASSGTTRSGETFTLPPLPANSTTDGGDPTDNNSYSVYALCRPQMKVSLNATGGDDSDVAVPVVGALRHVGAAALMGSMMRCSADQPELLSSNVMAESADGVIQLQFNASNGASADFVYVAVPTKATFTPTQ